MKLYKLFLFMALVTASLSVGCGGSDEEQPKNGTGGIAAPASVPVPPNGNYYNCPAGQVFNGATCVPYSGGPTSCVNGFVWNGSSCTTTCSSGTSWSDQQFGCVGTGQTIPQTTQNLYARYECQPISYSYPMYLYSCRWVYYSNVNQGRYCYSSPYGPICQ